MGESAETALPSHARQIDAIAAGQAAPGLDGLCRSWQRCLDEHRIDPGASRAPYVLTEGELEARREPLRALLHSARRDIDGLYSLARPGGYTLLLCDPGGIAIDHRGEAKDASTLKYWGIWLGGVWDEGVEGTNGIGTCIAERRPLVVHRTQHFRARHTDLSCSGAPIFDPDGDLAAVIDLSTFDPELPRAAHAMTGTLVTTTARAIEQRFFRERFHRASVVAFAPCESEPSPALLAIDADERIIGANRAARLRFRLDADAIRAGRSFWELFERDPHLFRRPDGADFLARLRPVDRCDEIVAAITPPENTASAWQDEAARAAHTRPRAELLRLLEDAEPACPARGGLSPAALRRVRDYVDAHLGERIGLEALAAAAGVSRFHFAHEFKRAVGLTPHRYVVRAMVERAQELLAQDDMSVAEVANAAGFADQSHLARQFRHWTGMSPQDWRRSRL